MSSWAAWGTFQEGLGGQQRLGGAPCWSLKASWLTNHLPPTTDSDQPPARERSQRPTPCPPAFFQGAHRPLPSQGRGCTGPEKEGRPPEGRCAHKQCSNPAARRFKREAKEGPMPTGERSLRHLSFFTCSVLETNKGSFQKKRIVSYKDTCQVMSNAVGGPLSTCPGGPGLSVGGPHP